MTYPIPEHETWFIHTPTKIDNYMGCQRQYLYEYIFGWSPASERNDKWFGTSWHKGQEHLLLTDYSDLNVMKAFDLFLAKYREKFDESTDELFSPKNPATAMRAYAKYVGRWARDHEDYEVLYTEIAVTVPLDEDITMHCNLDSIVRRRKDKKYGSIDHKTGKASPSRTWRDKFNLCSQSGGYHHVLYCLYSFEEVFGMEFSGTFFLKTKNDFERHPVYRDKSSMQNWLWNALWWIDSINHDIERFSEAKDSDPVLQCFPMNTENCTKYWGCTYHDFCMAWDNPLRFAEAPPLGFKKEYWDPREQESTHEMIL
uniref:Putative PD-(D/E)XK nuclease superfamily protein n=1 Tax=viral metagenome TaxID=1070528 RepID=A0A6M3JBE3_9ZZZZ